MTAKVKKSTPEEAKKIGLKNYANMVIQSYPVINERDAELIKSFENAIKLNELAIKEFQQKLQQLEQEKTTLTDSYDLQQNNKAIEDHVKEITTRETIISNTKFEIAKLKDSINTRNQAVAQEKKVLEELG